MSKQGYSLSQLADFIQADIRGDKDKCILGVGTLKTASQDELSFLANKKYRAQLADTQSGAVLLDSKEAEQCHEGLNCLIHPNPYLAYAILSQYFDTAKNTFKGVHATATVAKSVTLGADVVVGPNVVIEEGASIANGVELGANVVVGANTQIGENTKIKANVTLCHGVKIGDDVVVYSGAVIGADGFGYALNQPIPNLDHTKEGRWQKIAQLGGVCIGNRVEIGANTTIDRGALDDTMIADDVIIDNQVQIAHNVKVGRGTAIAGCVGIAGSAEVGERCSLGGGVGVAGHLSIADDTVVLGMSLVNRSLKESGIYASSTTIQPVNDWRKNMVRLTQLEQFNNRIKLIEKQLDKN